MLAVLAAHRCVMKDSYKVKTIISVRFDSWGASGSYHPFCDWSLALLEEAGRGTGFLLYDLSSMNSCTLRRKGLPDLRHALTSLTTLEGAKGRRCALHWAVG